MNSSHPACWSDEELLAQCKLTFSRASGPGGQNRNKVETAVYVEFTPAGISAQASEFRTQGDNRKVAMQRLRCRLAVELPQSYDSALIETLLGNSIDVWNHYCKHGKVNISESNPDWPIVLVVLMLTLRACEWDTGETATRLTTTASQLVKTLKKYTSALSMLNSERKKIGKSELT